MDTQLCSQQGRVKLMSCKVVKVFKAPLRRHLMMAHFPRWVNLGWSAESVAAVSFQTAASHTMLAGVGGGRLIKSAI